MNIKIPVCYYTDKNGNTVYDYDEMANEFENKLSELTGNVTVMCSISDDIAHKEEDEPLIPEWTLMNKSR
tara:strand:- start:2361 stop:2570 length:210 start_codon:yes stop_codon:yes gene_type:complete